MSATAPLAGNASDMVIYNDEFFGGMTEVIQQEADVFNAASGNALRMTTRISRGDFEKESFIKHVADLVRDRDPESNAAVSDKKFTQDELIKVKVNKGIGPVAQTLDSWRKIGQDPRLMSFYFGEQVGRQVAADYVNSTLTALVAAIGTESAIVYDAVLQDTDFPSKKIRAEFLTRAIALLGDKATRLKAWVMNSAAYFQLVEQQISDKVTNVADVVIYGGTPGTVGRPVIVTDSPALVGTGADSNPERYNILGLVEDAAEVAQSEEEVIHSEIVSGQQNLIMRVQGEYAYNIGLKGFAFGGTKNPNLAALGTGANWSFVMHDIKLSPGVLLQVAQL